MKELYFSPQSLGSKSQEMLHEFDAVRRRSRLERFAPRRSALLILDMQAYFLHTDSHACVPSASALLPGLQALSAAYARSKAALIFTRHLNTPHNAGNMATWWRDLITVDNPLSQITPDLDISQGLVLPKTQYDAFYETPLQALLRERGVTQVVICGVMTHLCCETTARSAFVRGFEVFFAVDGTATDTEAHHRAALLNLAHGFATPVLLPELLDVVYREEHAAS